MGIALGLVAAALAAAAGGELELVVRGPDANPAAGVEVRCRPDRYPEPPDGGAAHEATARTDPDGRVRLPWPG